MAMAQEKPSLGQDIVWRLEAFAYDLAAGLARIFPIDAVSDSLVGGPDSRTTVTWHADADGPYRVLVGGTDCSTGSPSSV